MDRDSVFITSKSGDLDSGADENVIGTPRVEIISDKIIF